MQKKNMRYSVGTKFLLKTGPGGFVEAEVVKVLDGYYDLSSKDIGLPLTLSDTSLEKIRVKENGHDNRNRHRARSR
jgi:hypothetical protein